MGPEAEPGRLTDGPYHHGPERYVGNEMPVHYVQMNPVGSGFFYLSDLIGQTGKTVRPSLLFSIGTSGAVQYTAGITEAKTIVAINRDKNSPIFQSADLGIVADAKTFLPLLTTKVKRAAVSKTAEV